MLNFGKLRNMESLYKYLVKISFISLLLAYTIIKMELNEYSAITKYFMNIKLTRILLLWRIL